ncbi:MAG TPA: XRE family transcriptional regulator [Pseudogracilibacillus sp.]|nr:XRE family transcriptional regulator [Pseudogracilibacillus sp.]
MKRYARKERGFIRLENVGKKIKQLRLRQKKTQQEIANQCDISKSLLSKIENGQTNSAIATLAKIADALEVKLSWLLEDDSEHDLVLLRKSERQYKEGAKHIGYSYELLANRSPYTGVEPTIVHVPPIHENTRVEGYTHAHDEFIYILEGTIKLKYKGKEHVLDQGDTAFFNGRNSHIFIPVDEAGAKVLTIFIEVDR